MARSLALPGYTGNALKVLRVNAAGDNIEFATGAVGTVTSVSVTTANGVSGSVATATTTPAISLTLGAITPTSVQVTSGAAATIFSKVGGTIFTNFTDTSSTSTNGAEDDLYSYTTPASILNTNGDAIEQREHVQFVSSATASRRLKKYFAGTLIFDSGSITLSLGGDFIVETMIIRESSTVVRVSVSVVTTSASSVPYATYTRITGLTLSGTNILKTTGIAAGAGAASADIVEKLSRVEWKSAN